MASAPRSVSRADSVRRRSSRWAMRTSVSRQSAPGKSGTRGVLAGRALLTVDYYRSRSSNLVTSLLPQVGTALGRLNPRFGPWEGPEGLPSAAVDQIRTFVPLLSNHLDGSNILAAASYTNFGEVNTQGIDLGLSYAFPAGWRSTSTLLLVRLRRWGTSPGNRRPVASQCTGSRIQPGAGVRPWPGRCEHRPAVGRCFPMGRWLLPGRRRGVHDG